MDQKQSQLISGFLLHLSEKNYSQAGKYLQAVVDAKQISRVQVANQQNIFNHEQR